MRDGNGWLFPTVKHWNAEALGWHVSKHGTRCEALQTTSMAVRQQFGHLGRDVARGVQLRHDHGSCFMPDDFQTQIRAWGMTPSFAFVGQPETNGVVERFFRTLKEQIVHGRVYETIEDVRELVRAFIACYNAVWLVEKNSYPSPTALRTNLPPCPWPRNPTKCPRNRVWFIMTSGHPGSYTSLTDVTGVSRIGMTIRRPD